MLHPQLQLGFFVRANEFAFIDFDYDDILLCFQFPG